MRKTFSPFTVALVLSLAVSVSAQNREFSWSDMFCDFTGTYDPNRVTEQQLNDTWMLIEFGMGLPLQTDQTVWDPSEIGDLDVAALDAEYAEAKKRLESLKPADSDYFRSLKQRHLKTLETSYRLKRVTLLAHTNASVLKNVEGQEACFTKWGAPVVAGGDTLLSAWKTLLVEQKERNSRPEMLQQRFDERYASADRDKWALIEVLSFGWWNCVNSSIPYVDSDGTPEQEFKKLFVKVVEKDCEEPE